MAAAEGAGHLYPVDIKDIKLESLEAESCAYHAKIFEQPSSAAKFFSVPGREKVKLEASAMQFLPLYREESKPALLVLNDPQDKNTVLAIYMRGSWCLTEDIVKTTDPSREGLMQVQTFAERIVLFVLNCIIFGMLERDSTCDVLFTPHSEKECAKIFWRSGEAAAFYTIKAKGNLCDSHTSQCYQLPVLDTMFVRRKFRRCGLGLKMLHDFCQTFPAEDALGISCPVSFGMYQVCQRFFETNPEEQSRLWEVESPGDWSQRMNIWLKIQLEPNLLKQMDVSCHSEQFPNDEPGPSAEDWTRSEKKGEQVPQFKTSVDEAKLRRSDQEMAFNLRSHDGECADQQGTDVRQCWGSQKRARGSAEDRTPKQRRGMP